jgi:serine phosphatase RsbU (regulator of sigma subunit)
MRFYESAREQERMHRELEIARRIQLSALPADIPQFPGFDIAAESIPAYEVGGDFYDVLTRHDSVTFLVGDVSGKGTSAALYLARIQGILRTIESYQPTLWELFVRANTQIFNRLERHVYLTLAGLRVDMLSNRVECVRAGHLPMLHYRAADGSVAEHRPDGVGVGLDQRLFAEHLEVDAFTTAPGDALVLLTDGVTEAANDEHDQFGIDRVRDILAAVGSSHAAVIRDEILRAVRAHCGDAAMMDDITLLILKIT